MVERLNAVCDVIAINKRVLKEATEGLQSYLFTFSKIEPIVPKDGYEGLGVFFETPLGEVVVFFPKREDSSVAVYANGEFRYGPSSYGEFQMAVENILGLLYERLLELTKPRLKR
jgi:hypothetical protein